MVAIFVSVQKCFDFLGYDNGAFKGDNVSVPACMVGLPSSIGTLVSRHVCVRDIDILFMVREKKNDTHGPFSCGI